MYAIAGIVNSNSDSSLIEKMLNGSYPCKDSALKIYAFDGCVFAKKALGKKDLGSDSTSSSIVFSGKIYNYESLKSELEALGISFTSSSDEELIWLGFKAFGKEIIEKLEGIFAFALWNETDNELILARDPFGVKSVYYTTAENSFVFSSSLKGFLSLDGFKKEFNEEILASYLCFNSVATSETFFKGVFRLEPGHYLTFKNGKTEKTCYFKPKFAPEKKELDTLTDEINTAVQKAVFTQTKDCKVGSFLSSGVDSSYIVSVLKPENTFTVGYSDSRYDETVYSTELCDALSIKNSVKVVTPKEYLDKFSSFIYSLDEPLANPSAPAIFLGVESASSLVDVILSGEGADELFGGYLSYNDDNSQSKYAKIPFVLRRLAYKIADMLPEASGLNFVWRSGQKLEEHHIGLGRIFRDKDAVSLLKNKNQVSTRTITAPYYEEYKNCSSLQKRQAIDYYFWLINDFVFAVVKSAENFGVEARFPLLDKELCNIAMHLTDDMKLNGKTTKYAFRRAAEKAIPTDAHKKKKLGFPVPLKEWIKDDLFYNEIKEKFASDTAKQFFNQKKILKLLELHKSGKKDCYKKIWAIYSFLVWYENFF